MNNSASFNINGLLTIIFHNDLGYSVDLCITTKLFKNTLDYQAPVNNR